MNQKPGHWEIYIVRSRTGKLYTGISTDVERRFREHRAGKRGARFFRLSPASEIVYREAQPDRAAASRREAAIKKMTRCQKLALIDDL